MRTTHAGRSAGTPEPVPASSGSGPLVQRDYWAVLDSSLRPSEVVTLVRTRFADFAPPDLVGFRRADGRDVPLELRDDLEVKIRFAGSCQVRVVHQTPTSFTLATLAGHPEAGRITFGAYRNREREVVFHIRSRARSSSFSRRVGFLVTGDPMQSGTWTDFIDRLAAGLGARIIGEIHAESRFVEDEPEDRRAPDAPTFVARAD